MLETEKFWAVSDVHLHPDYPLRTELFTSFLRKASRETPVLLILGDLFEYWVGPYSFQKNTYPRALRTLKEIQEGGCEVFFVAGNRDFLAVSDLKDLFGGDVFQYGVRVRQDTRDWLAVHGDTLCHSDTLYQCFRRFFRDTAVCRMAKYLPGSIKMRLVRTLREASRYKLKHMSENDADVSRYRCRELLRRNFDALVFGHIHRKQEKQIDIQGFSKNIYSLGDWTVERGGTYLVAEPDSVNFFQFELESE